MNLSAWRLLLFAIAGLVTIAILTFQGDSHHEELESVDRHTGLSPDELVEIARRSGSAVAALEMLARHEHRFEGHERGSAALALLAAELATDAELAGEDVERHPDAPALLDERLRARAEHAAFAGSAPSADATPGAGAALAERLRLVEADVAVRAATEAFFAATGQQGRLDEGFAAAPDGHALLFQERLSAGATATADDYFALANAFRSEGRERARLRWLLDGYAAFPTDPHARNPLAAAYLDHNRFVEARALLAQARADGADDMAFWRLEVRLGLLAADPECEAAALRVVIAREEHPADLRRLIDLCRYVGRPAAAVEAADRLAELSGSHQDRELSVFLSLEAGLVEHALERLAANAASAADPRPWRERSVAYALQDHRVEHALADLASLARDYPADPYRDDLESLLRRLDRRTELAELLHGRFEADPRNGDRAEELCQLYLALERRPEAVAVLERHMHALDTPRAFFAELASFKGGELAGVDDAARAWAASDLLVAADLALVMRAVRPWLREATYRGIVAQLAARFGDAPLARGDHLELISSLFAAGELEEATRRLHAHVEAPGTTQAERLAAAELLFASGRYEPSLEHYVAVLTADPLQPTALLRVGQILIWTGDPAEAVNPLQKCLRAGPPDRALVEALLGEALWSAGRHADARRRLESALVLLEKRRPPTEEEQAWLARVHSRLGHTRRARKLYEALIAQRPNELDLVLDHVEFLTGADELELARHWMDHAKTLAPRHPRGLRIEAALAVREERFDEAMLAMNAARELGQGPDPGLEAELAHALKLSGEWRGSLEAYQRAYELAPNDRDIGHALRDSQDDLAALIAGQARHYAVADDDATSLTLAASAVVLGEATRLTGALSWQSYEGVTVTAGDVEEELVVGDLALTHARSATHDLSGGVRGYASAPGSDVGLWVGWEYASDVPRTQARARAYFDDLWNDPAGAVGLAGRSSGVELDLQRDLSTSAWLALNGHYRVLELDAPGADGHADDGQVLGGAAVGMRLHGEEPAVIDGFRADRSALFPNSPYLAGPPAENEGALVHAWVAYEAIRLLGDEDVADVVPIGTSFDYLTLGASAEDRLSEHLGGRLDGYVGTDVGEDDFLWGLAGSLTWRPSYAGELYLRAGYGQALGRAEDDDDASEVVLGFYLRR